MTQHNATTDELPADLAERLDRLARTQTADSTPWPGVDHAIRRSHRRRVASVSGVVTISLLVAGAVFSGALQPTKFQIRPTPPAVTSPTATTPPVHGSKPAPLTLQSGGFLNGTGGSLAASAGWQDGLRAQVITQAKSPSTKVTSAKDVLVLWAGDLDGVRYAVTMFRIHQSRGATHWATGTFEGPAGAAPSAMSSDGWSIENGSEVPAATDGLFVKPDVKGRHAAVVFVVAPRASRVEVADTRRFLPDGTVTTTWRDLAKQGGAVWAGTLTPAEAYLGNYRTVGMDDGEDSSTSTGSFQPDVAGVSLPGVDAAGIARSSLALYGLGPSIEEHPVLAASRPIGSHSNGTSTLSATVLKSRDGGYLYGLAETWHKRGTKPHGLILREAVVSTQPFADPASFMAALRVGAFNEIHRPDHYLVIAPAGATSIKIGDVTAAVHNRLAVVDVPRTELLREQSALLNQQDNDPPPTLPVVTVQALDAHGTVIGVVRSVTINDDQSTTQTGQIEEDF